MDFEDELDYEEETKAQTSKKVKSKIKLRNENHLEQDQILFDNNIIKPDSNRAQAAKFNLISISNLDNEEKPYKKSSKTPKATKRSLFQKGKGIKNGSGFGSNLLPETPKAYQNHQKKSNKGKKLKNATARYTLNEVQYLQDSASVNDAKNNRGGVVNSEIFLDPFQRYVSDQNFQFAHDLDQETPSRSVQISKKLPQFLVKPKVSESQALGRIKQDMIKQEQDNFQLTSLSINDQFNEIKEKDKKRLSQLKNRLAHMDNTIFQ
eukprot:403344454